MAVYDGVIKVTPDVDRANKVKWRDVDVIVNSLSIRGAFQPRTRNSIPLITDQYFLPGETGQHSFFQASKSEDWFSWAIAGQGLQRGHLTHVKVFDQIRAKLADTIFARLCPTAAAACATPTSAGPADLPSTAAAAPAASTDLASAFRALQLPTATPAPKPSLKRKVAAQNPVLIRMPRRPPCVDPDCEDFIEFYAMERSMNNRSLWLHISCIQWLCAFAADELHCQGVVSRSCPKPSAGRRGKLACNFAGNTANFPGLWISPYNYADQSTYFHWNDPSADPLKLRDESTHRSHGTYRQVNMKSLTQAIWDEFANNDLGLPPGQSLILATKTQRRELVKQLIKAWCTAILNDTEDEFLRARGLEVWAQSTAAAAREGDAETPHKRRRLEGGRTDAEGVGEVNPDTQE